MIQKCSILLILNPTKAGTGRKLEWQSRKQLHDPFRVQTTHLSWNARSAPIDFHLLGTVSLRIPYSLLTIILMLNVSRVVFLDMQ